MKPVWPFGYTSDGINSQVANVPFNVPQRPVIDPRELMPFVARSRSKAVGAQIGVANVVDSTAQVDLAAQVGFAERDFDHSGQFNRPIQQPQTQGFYLLLRAALFGEQQ
jgi:hypothetical protein